MYKNLVEAVPTMTQSEAREYVNAQTFIEHGMADTAARTMSALVRACRTQRSYKALMTAAQEMGIAQHPDFVI
jgi:hypothetical protein